MLRLLSLAAFLVLICPVASAQPAPEAPAGAAAPVPASQNPDANQGASVAISEGAPGAPVVAPVASPPASPPAVQPPPLTVAAVSAPAAPTAALTPVDVVTAAPAPDAPVGLARLRAGDAAAHRAYLGETALTVPSGGVVLEARLPTYSAGGVGASVGVTDRLQLGATAIWASDDTTAFAVSGKLQLARRATWAVAVQGMVLGTSDDADADTVAAGVVASLCLDRSCRVLVSGNLAVADGDLWADGEGDADREGDTAIPVVGGASVTAGSDRFRVVGEAHGTEDEDGDSLSFLYGGARLMRPGWSLEAGLGIASVDEDVYLLPLLGASLRI